MDVKGLSLHQIGTNLTCLLKPNYHKIAPSCVSQALLVDKERKQVLMKSRIIKLEAVDIRTGIPNLEHVLQVPQLLLCHQAQALNQGIATYWVNINLPTLSYKQHFLQKQAMILHTSNLERLVKSQAKDLLALLQERSSSTEGIFLLATSDRASQEIREALDSEVEVQLQSQPMCLLAVILKVNPMTCSPAAPGSVAAEGHLPEQEPKARSCCSARVLGMLPVLPGHWSQPHPQPLPLQDFLRKIPSQLLQTQLYQQWMDALQKTSRQERLAGLKE
ncbi:hypothetical protein Q9233_008151 [Columba guinea]|nr:hypothetical protein Q9233_008151 [Columba guinea]